MDKTGVGDAVVDELETIRVGSVNGVFFTEAEKENMLNRLKLLMEKKLLEIPGDDRQLNPDKRTAIRVPPTQNSTRTNPPQVQASIDCHYCVTF
jgi:phage FluMu gp28-like protein